MRIVLADIPSQPWKNAGGFTRELARNDVSDEAEQPMLWRISLAEIDQDGTFSTFPGLRRIHCITSGAGLCLSNADHQLEAVPLQSLCFDGGLELQAQLNDGPCQAFNVIYDPARITARMQICTRESAPEIYEFSTGVCLVLVLSGVARLNTDQQEELLREGEAWLSDRVLAAEVTEGSRFLLLTLNQV